MRLKQQLKGNILYLNDKQLIQHATSRTYKRENAWDSIEHEFEELDKNHTELICFISQNHKNTIEFSRMQEALGGAAAVWDENEAAENEGLVSDKKREKTREKKYYLYSRGTESAPNPDRDPNQEDDRLSRIESVASVLSVESQEFFGSEMDEEQGVREDLKMNQKIREKKSKNSDKALIRP